MIKKKNKKSSLSTVELGHMGEQQQQQQQPVSDQKFKFPASEPYQVQFQHRHYAETSNLRENAVGSIHNCNGGRSSMSSISSISSINGNNDKNFNGKNNKNFNPITNDPQANDLWITFYDFREPVHIRAGRLVSAGPLSFASIIRSDPFLRVTLLKIRRDKCGLKSLGKDDLVKQILMDKENVNRGVEQTFQARLLENETLDELKLPKERNDTQLFESARVDCETETIMKIEECLPTHRLLWLLIDKFFSSPLVVCMPFITETHFRSRIQDIIGPRIDEDVKITKANIKRRFDFAHVGIALIIMRLTSLSISRTNHNSLDELLILETPIGIQSINTAQMCLNQFRLLRRASMPIIQCSLLMRMYRKFAPEEGDGSIVGDSEVFLGMLLQMANSIGMNRDLSHSIKTSALREHPKLVNCWRFIWHEIVSLDLEQSFMKGNPLLVDENSFDTELPSIVDEHNLEDSALMQASVTNFGITDEINQLVRVILKDVLNLKKPVKVSELLLKTTKLEVYLDSHFCSLETLLKLPTVTQSQVALKIHKFKNYIELKTALYTICYHIFNNSPTFNFPVLWKIWKIGMELVPLSYMLLTIDNGKTNYFEELFGCGAQLILVPSIIGALHKVSQLLVGFILRCLDSKHNFPPSDEGLLIAKMLDKLMDSYSLIRDTYASISATYYQAWRNCKGIDFYREMLIAEDNIMDRQSNVNEQAKNLPDEINHVKAIPVRNELYEMNQYQLAQLVELITSNTYESPILEMLSAKMKKREHRGDSMSSSNTPPPQGFHVNQNVMTNSELDVLWFQMMNQEVPLNDSPVFISQDFDIFGLDQFEQM